MSVFGRPNSGLFALVRVLFVLWFVDLVSVRVWVAVRLVRLAVRVRLGSRFDRVSLYAGVSVLIGLCICVRVRVFQFRLVII